MSKFSKLSILIDNPDSWLHEYREQLEDCLAFWADRVEYCTLAEELQPGEVLFLLSCCEKLDEQFLQLHKHNLVIHESDLPSGRGNSPLTWQVEQGAQFIPMTLFEAAAQIDHGDYYYKTGFPLDGHELIDDLRSKQVEHSLMLMNMFLQAFPHVQAKVQHGDESYFPARKSEHNLLNAHKTLAEQFEQMRVADNQRYPLHFWYRDHKYILKVFKDEQCLSSCSPS